MSDELQDPKQVRLTLKFLPSKFPWHNRLKHGLKFLLRVCSLRCDCIEYDVDQGEQHQGEKREITP